MIESLPSKAILLINSCGQNDSVCLITIPKRICQPPTLSRGAESILFILDKLKIKQYISRKKLMGVIVVSGPGNFTTTKVGVAIANTIAWLGKLPIHGITPDKIHLSFDELQSMIKNQSLSIVKSNLLPPNITTRRPD